jgi:hypothetical protein
MLDGHTTVVKQKVVTPHTPTNKNGFISVDEVQAGSKRTWQGLVPQVINLLYSFKPLQLPLQRSPHCTPERHPPNPP